MQPVSESIVFTAIRQCLETADHYGRQRNRRDAEFHLNTADAHATGSFSAAKWMIWPRDAKWRGIMA
jgi:hypothetical protein